MPDASSKQQTKQKYKLNHQQIGVPPDSALPIREKQTNKNSAQILPYAKLTQTTGPILGGQKSKEKRNSTLIKERIQISLMPGKGDLKHNNFKKNNGKAEKYCSNEETN